MALLAAGIVVAAPAPAAEPAAAPARPKWEIGVSTIGFAVADYPASDEYRTRVLPFPYFVYRGRTLRADQQGSRLRRTLSPSVEIAVSGGGAFAVDSGGSEARAGMPDLGYLLELGPNLRLNWRAPMDARTYLNLPVRGVLSIGDPGVNWRGLVFAPELGFVHPGPWGDATSLRVSLAATFATQALHDYFYTVEPRYVTPTRPAYAASEGYLGSSLGALASRPLGERLRGFVSLRLYRYAGAANTGSPLFRDNDGYTAAIGLSWSFARSREPAVADWEPAQ